MCRLRSLTPSRMEQVATHQHLLRVWEQVHCTFLHNSSLAGLFDMRSVYVEHQNLHGASKDWLVGHCCSSWSWQCNSGDCGQQSSTAMQSGLPHEVKQHQNCVYDCVAVLKNLSWLDRLLPVWIIIAMVVGVVLGYFAPAVKQALQVSNIAGVSLPIALGLWWMMFPVLTKVKYELLGLLLRQKAVAKQFTVSFILNWVIGPALMVGLAWACLSDLPHYRNGVILVGLARCIAMVLIWNELSLGHNELCAVMVAINSVLQIVLYSPLALFYIKVVSRGDDVDVGFWPVAKSVLLFLGVPLVAGIVLRYILLLIKDKEWFETKFMPWFGPTALLALLYTIIVMFASQGDKIIGEIGNVARVAVPMLIYFSLMFFASLAISYYCHMNYSYAVTQAFTASSNNFELAIAVAVGTFGIESAEALAATVGPLIEVPVLLGLVYVALWIKKRFWDARDQHLKEIGKYPLDIHNVIAAKAEADHNNAIALAAKDAQDSSKNAQTS
eukprot:jgi/Chrzof1/6000/Cz17g00070.t1